MTSVGLYPLFTVTENSFLTKEYSITERADDSWSYLQERERLVDFLYEAVHVVISFLNDPPAQNF